MDIAIRPVTEITGCEHFQKLEGIIWGAPLVDYVPTHIAITVIKNGGMILGAYADDGPAETGGMVGLAFWWLGAAHDPADPPGSPLRLKACSHSVGVLPAWQGRGIGLRLKLAQRDAILAQGLTDWMTWTYDPLYRPNAVFNIHRLGATCRTYDRNVYGAMQDALNAGLPSDRCTVDWRLRSPAILQDATRPRPTPGWDPAALIVPPITNAPSGFARPVDQEIVLDGRPIAVPLPDDIAAIRRADVELALAWRLYLRHALETAFAAGYVMTDCVHWPQHGWRYILQPAE
jgi:predicted GNAT superfamily acetyltransferase